MYSIVGFTIKVDALFTGKGTFLLCYCQTKTYIRIIACCAI